MKKIILLISYLISNVGYSYELGIRYNNVVPREVGLFDEIMEHGGKILELKYERDICPNIYFEQAIGGYFDSDFDKVTSSLSESSIGLKVKSNGVVVKFSQGAAYTPNIPTLTPLEFGTHFSIGLEDSNGVSIALERSHYSNGKSVESNIGMNSTGLVLSMRF